KASAYDDAERCLPEGHAEDGDGQHADEDRRELQIGRGPGPEQLAWLAVALRLGDVFVAARFYRDDLIAVGAVGLHGGFGRCHRHTVIPATTNRNPSKRAGNKTASQQGAGRREDTRGERRPVRRRQLAHPRPLGHRGDRSAIVTGVVASRTAAAHWTIARKNC